MLALQFLYFRWAYT